MKQSKLTAELKANALKVASELPERLLKGDKVSHKASYRKRKRGIELDWIEQSYNQLDGEWADWLKVARWYEHKVPSQDRYDLRHDIILRLAKIASKHNTLSQAGMCRVASYMVADYWRAHYKLTSGLDCGHCSTKQRQKCRSEWLYSECPKLIKLEYLSKPITDGDGNLTELGELIADDHAIDLDAWLDAETFKLGCPKRLIAIAEKLDRGESLDGKDRKYLCKWRKKEQPKLF